METEWIAAEFLAEFLVVVHISGEGALKVV